MTEAEVGVMSLLAVKMQEGAMSQGIWAASGIWNRQETGFFPRASRKDIALMTPTWNLAQ